MCLKESARVKEAGLAVVGGRDYLCEGERVGHRADQDLAKFAVQVRTLDSVQMGVDPEDPGKHPVPQTRWHGNHPIGARVTSLVPD